MASWLERSTLKRVVWVKALFTYNSNVLYSAERSKNKIEVQSVLAKLLIIIFCHHLPPSFCRLSCLVSSQYMVRQFKIQLISNLILLAILIVF